MKPCSIPYITSEDNVFLFYCRTKLYRAGTSAATLNVGLPCNIFSLTFQPFFPLHKFLGELFHLYVFSPPHNFIQCNK